jgi:hypothetical protein
MQEYIRIFPSKFNYSEKLPFIGTITPLSFCKNKRIKKDKVLNFFLFPIRRRILLYYNTTTSKFASVRVYLDRELVINTVALNLVQVLVFQELENQLLRGFLFPIYITSQVI